MTDDAYLQAVAQAEADRRRDEAEIVDRANLVINMLRHTSGAARTQAREAIERGFRAEAILAAIRDLPSQEDLLTNAMARAMWELAKRAVTELEG